MARFNPKLFVMCTFEFVGKLGFGLGEFSRAAGCDLEFTLSLPPCVLLR